MKKSIAAILTAMAMVVALVLPMTAFADSGIPAGKSAKSYDETFTPSKDEPDYEVVVDEFDEEEAEDVDADVDVEVEEEGVTLEIDVDDNSILDAAKAKANELSASIQALDVNLPNGEFDIDYKLSDGAWKLATPAKLFVKDGKSYARLAFNNPDLEKIILNGKEILPTKWINVDGIKGKLPVFDLPLLALGAKTGFDLYNKNGDVETYDLTVNKYDTAVSADVEEGTKYRNYYDASGEAHHVIVAEDTKVAKESKLNSVWGPLAVLLGEGVVGAGLLAAGRRRKND